MDIQHFQTFLLVARLGNMTQAAEQLNFTQPTVTGQIRALEQHFGVLLFDRVGKKLYLTEAGKKLTAYAEKLLAVYNEAQESLREDQGIINLGTATTIVNYFLLPFVEKLKQEMPKCAVTVEMCPNTPTVVKGILENRFDLGFVQNGVPADCLTGFEVFTEQVVWVVHHKLAKKHRFSTDITDYPLLAYKTGGLFRTFYEDALGSGSFEPVIEYTDSEVMKNAIMKGFGSGALPMVIARQHLEEGTLIEFANMPRCQFSIWIVHHKDKILTRAATSLLKILHEVAAD